MNGMLYLVPFISALVLSLLIVVSILMFSRKGATGMRAEGRHIHGREVSRLGGVAIILSFLAALALDPRLVIEPKLVAVMIVALLILFVGVWDDFKELDWKIQLFFQCVIAAAVFAVGIRVEALGGISIRDVVDGKNLAMAISFVGTGAWLVMIMNAVNWSDGVDGLSGGVTLISAATILALSLKPEVHQPPVGIICAALGGSVLGFLFFNFHPARIFAGTSGSMFMGYMLAVLAIFAGTKIATTLLVLALPLFDAAWVIKERYLMKKSIFSPDKGHLHHRLLALGWSQKKINLFFFSITSAVAVIALNTRTIGKIVTIMAVFAVLIAVLSLINRKTRHVRTV